jgi:N-acetylmuramoyl-L-alanine amidase
MKTKEYSTKLIKKQTIILCLLGIAGGILTYGFRYNYIILNLSAPTAHTLTLPIQKKKVRLYYWRNTYYRYEDQELLWSNQLDQALQALVSSWLLLVEQEDLIRHKINVQAVSLSDNNRQALISCDHSLFNTEQSLAEKLSLLEALFATLQAADLSITHLQLLVQNQPLPDAHLDFSQPLPLSLFNSQNATQISKKFCPATPISIIVSPAGDAMNAGRMIQDVTERGITLQCAEALKNVLRERLPRIPIIITRTAGETLEPLQEATLANRLKATLYIHLQAYYRKEAGTALHIYYMSYNNTTDHWPIRSSKLELTPLRQSYRKEFKNTVSLCTALERNLKNLSYSTTQSLGIPSKSLMGIAIPALIIELGLSTSDDWSKLVQPLAQAISEALSHETQGTTSNTFSSKGHKPDHTYPN